MLQIHQRGVVAESTDLDPACLGPSPRFASHWLRDLGEVTATVWVAACLSKKMGNATAFTFLGYSRDSYVLSLSWALLGISYY